MRKSRTEKSGKPLPYIFMLTFISGVTVGAVFALFNPGSFTFDITTASKLSVFLSSFKSFVKPCLVIWLSGFTGFSVYVSAGTLIYRGSLFGFVTGCIIKQCGIKAALSATLPQNILFFPLFLFISLAAAGQKNRLNLVYLIVLILSILICAFSALIDTYITSFFINLTL